MRFDRAAPSSPGHVTKGTRALTLNPALLCQASKVVHAVVKDTPAVVAGVKVLLQQRSHDPQVRERHVLAFRRFLLPRLHWLRAAVLPLCAAAAAGGRTRRSCGSCTPQQVHDDLQSIAKLVPDKLSSPGVNCAWSLA